MALGAEDSVALPARSLPRALAALRKRTRVLLRWLFVLGRNRSAERVPTANHLGHFRQKQWTGADEEKSGQRVQHVKQCEVEKINCAETVQDDGQRGEQCAGKQRRRAQPPRAAPRHDAITKERDEFHKRRVKEREAPPARKKKKHGSETDESENRSAPCVPGRFGFKAIEADYVTRIVKQPSASDRTANRETISFKSHSDV